MYGLLLLGPVLTSLIVIVQPIVCRSQDIGQKVIAAYGPYLEYLTEPLWCVQMDVPPRHRRTKGISLDVSRIQSPMLRLKSSGQVWRLLSTYRITSKPKERHNSHQILPFSTDEIRLKTQ